MVIFDLTNPMAYGYRGTLFLKYFGDTEQACIDWETVCTLSMCELNGLGGSHRPL